MCTWITPCFINVDFNSLFPDRHQLCDLLFILPLEHGTGHIKQLSPGLEHTQCLQKNLLLNFRERVQVIGMTQTFNIRVAAYYAAGRTGGINQYTIEHAPIPPALCVGSVADNQLGMQTQAIEILLHPLHAQGFEFDSCHFNVRR